MRGIRSALAFAFDVVRTFTWNRLLLVQLLALAIDAVANLVMILPDGIVLLRFVIAQTMAFSIVLAASIGDQARAWGVRTSIAYAVPMFAMSVLGGYVQSWILIALNAEPPEWDWMSVIDIGSEILTYGTMVVVIYVEHHRRMDFARRMRAAELGRALNEQQLARVRLTEARAEVDPATLTVELDALQKLYQAGAAEADRVFDELIERLRAKLTTDHSREGSHSRQGRAMAVWP